MQYEAYSDYENLRDTFYSAVLEQQNIVLQAGSLNDPVRGFAHSVRKGLEKQPRQLECRFLYDARGSELFFRIHQRGDSAFEPSPTDAEGFQLSRVLGCHYRLDGTRDDRGHWSFDLREKSSP